MESKCNRCLNLVGRYFTKKRAYERCSFFEVQEQKYTCLPVVIESIKSFLSISLMSSVCQFFYLIFMVHYTKNKYPSHLLTKNVEST